MTRWRWILLAAIAAALFPTAVWAEDTFRIGGRGAARGVDGKPLSGKDGPVRLLVPEDGKPARWTYGITRITLVDGRRSVPER